MKIKIITGVLFFSFSLILTAQTVSKEEITKNVTFLSSDALEGRNTGTNGELLAAGYIMAKFQQMGLTPKGTKGYMQEFSVKPKYNPHAKVQVDTSKAVTGRNIIGFIDNKAAKTIVIGAHYDHLGYGEEGSLSSGEPAIHNGADDNASGVSAIIQLARILKDKNKASNYLIIAFSGEERGLWGSNWFAKHSVIDIKSINYMINLDMIGRLGPDLKLMIYGTGTAKVWDKELDKLTKDKFHLIKKPSGLGPSDHMSFYLQDIPVLHFFTGQHEDYHKPSDDADKINYDGIVSIVQLIDNLITDLDANEKLTFIKTKDEDSNKAPAYSVTLGVIPDYMFEGKGMRIDGIKDNRPAFNAGMKKGDVVIKMGKHEVITMMDYMKSLSKFKKGDKTKVTIVRDQKEMKLDVKF